MRVQDMKAGDRPLKYAKLSVKLLSSTGKSLSTVIHRGQFLANAIVALIAPPRSLGTTYFCS